MGPYVHGGAYPNIVASTLNLEPAKNPAFRTSPCFDKDQYYEKTQAPGSKDP